MAKTVGPKIKEIRLKKGMKQKELADLMGYKYSSTLSEIENGIKGIDANRILIAARVLGVDLNEILNENNLEVRTEGEEVS